MPTGEFLSKPELHDLTGFARAKAQAGWLASRGIPYRLDGSRVIVCRCDAREWVQGKPLVVSSGVPNWASVR